MCRSFASLKEQNMKKSIAFLLIALICLSLLSLLAVAEGDPAVLPEETEENAQRVSPLWFGIGVGVLAAIGTGIWFYVKRKDNT